MSYYDRPMSNKRDESSGRERARTKSDAHEVETVERRTINQLLQRALEEAANPGFGDEEPEIMKAPTDGNGISAVVMVENTYLDFSVRT